MSICVAIGKNTKESEITRALEYYDNEDIFFALDEIPTNYRIQTEKYACVMFNHIVYSFDGRVVFLNHNDYNAISHITQKQKKTLFVDKEKLKEVNGSLIKNTEVLLCNKNNIRKAKNAELQSLFRQ